MTFWQKKTNNYGAVICYFKVTDSNIKSKFQLIKTLEEADLKMPYWKTEKEIILKVEYKFVNYKDDCFQGEMYNINVDFESYCIDNIENPIKGYYCKVLGVKKVEMIVEVDDDSN